MGGRAEAYGRVMVVCVRTADFGSPTGLMVNRLRRGYIGFA
jgi:hypothetical protein